ncbi:MAG: methylenetetrahydrofolate reductase C-terminal domain-containing protein [Lentisphaeria bacterium]|nr:methylenetetrahydrofolate reductase C-terminal domain-containing protein [Lentisphaeria bacterium]
MNRQNGIQLQMNFGGQSEENQFKKQVYAADFTILFEISTPGSDADLQTSAARLSPLTGFILEKKELPCGIAFIDSNPERPSSPILDFAAAVAPENRDSHVIYLSGRGKDEETVAGFLAQCRLEGFKNIVCVSGAPSVKQKNARVFESVKMLQMNQESESPLFAGAVVNPYKYEICAAVAQSLKLAKKARAGASFAVTQFGWDAAKLQEISWQMHRNNCNIPLFARQMLLTPAAAVELCSGNYPGIRFSKNFQTAIRTEMQLSTSQFLAAQWRRFQLNVAGARFLGYSGIQIGGIETLATAKTAYQMILESFKEFPSYQDWLDAVKDYYSQMDIAPYPWRYYLFENLLRPDTNREDASDSRKAIPEPLSGEMFRYKLAKTLFSKSHLHPAAERRLSKKMIVSCKGCSQCRLPMTLFVCPEACPLGFCNGPCGEVDVSGKCFLSDTECVYAKHVRLAVALQDYTFLEETVI